MTPARTRPPRPDGASVGSDPEAKPVRVVVVEDSTVQRAHLRRLIESAGDLTVVAEAATAEEAVAAVRRTRPDVATIDLDIPGRGVEAIRSIMASRPTPMLIVTAAVGGVRAASVVEALAEGAADALPKPSRWSAVDEEVLRSKLRDLAGLSIRPPSPVPARAGAVVAIAASTGGPAALAEVLAGLGRLAAPVLIVQHLHPDFGAAFVAWMARSCVLPVRVATDGQPIRPGEVLVAPGDSHLRLGPDRRVILSDEPAALHRPSADELFRSVAQHAGARAVGVVLTGMGEDGAAGLLAIRKAGGTTFVQDESTSTVFGMPRAALAAGASDKALPLHALGPAVRRAVERLRAST